MQRAEVSHAVRVDLVAAADVHRIRKRQPENAPPTKDVEVVALGLGVGHKIKVKKMLAALQASSPPVAPAAEVEDKFFAKQL